ncbi:hypothetical protein FHT40_003327 [Mycolicibacterium sp. BK556]|uniref:hypothetical protein n=1 Tax=unclassified Mycolicibacterium TaxID=2636767 RepID=UPI00160E188A|nr:MULTISPECIES: hypothetical protein [unclassified Mycolicibacterium]MBB3603666.1 hypothetical protein [Mycolicibacterium sp. BK556]MBB3633861.1 hypothetical protein [Mycolicibacterium sp. BK607]MBB3751443.1 hypothetical protein [Mycolicibacterium sp. BK634]
MRKIGFATVAAFGLIGLGMFVSDGTALAGGLDASPPAIIDDDGFQEYHTSTYPESSSWPGQSSHPCCSR